MAFRNLREELEEELAEMSGASVWASAVIDGFKLTGARDLSKKAAANAAYRERYRGRRAGQRLPQEVLADCRNLELSVSDVSVKWGITRGTVLRWRQNPDKQPCRGPKPALVIPVFELLTSPRVALAAKYGVGVSWVSTLRRRAVKLSGVLPAEAPHSPLRYAFLVPDADLLSLPRATLADRLQVSLGAVDRLRREAKARARQRGEDPPRFVARGAARTRPYALEDLLGSAPPQVLAKKYGVTPAAISSRRTRERAKVKNVNVPTHAGSENPTEPSVASAGQPEAGRGEVRHP